MRRSLLAWYARQRRSLPWRGERDPYRVWVSEVMLQQTRVAVALSYYRSFLERFPTIAALARAREEDVLAAWAGLGYYRRARSLHRAARQVMHEFGGTVPRDPATFGRLPGVGRYTAGAVLSIAFDRTLPALDGNAARVLSRLFAVPAAVRDPRGAGILWKLAATLVPMRRPGDWNQALMELGASLCGPRSPRCEACPVRVRCQARTLGRVEEFPPRAPRPAPARVRQAVVLVERGGRMLVIRREGPRLEGLWEPPSVELSARRARAPVAVRRALRGELRRLGVRARLRPTPASIRCTITRHAIEAAVWRGTPAGPLARSARLRWVDPRAPKLALTALARKVAEVRARV